MNVTPSSVSNGNPFLTVAEVQSRGDRISPTAQASRYLLSQSFAENIYLHVAAASGTPVVAWLPENLRMYPLPSDRPDMSYWADAVIQRMYQLCSLGYDVRFRGVVMYQGSADRQEDRAPYYAENLRRLKAYGRGIFEAAGWHNVPWYQTVSPSWGAPTPTEWVTMVQQAQRDVTAEDAGGLSWCTESDNPLGAPIVFTDGIHPDAESYERIGVVMGQMIMSADKFSTK